MEVDEEVPFAGFKVGDEEVGLGVGCKVGLGVIGAGASSAEAGADARSFPSSETSFGASLKRRLSRKMQRRPNNAMMET